MNQSKIKKACCLDENGRKLTYHLQCQRCRQTADEQERLSLRGQRPDGVSREIDPAGRLLVPMTEVVMVQTDDGYQFKQERYRAGSPARIGDAFDLMDAQSRRSGGSAPFTGDQVSTGRHYAELVEARSKTGVKPSSAFSDRVAGGRGGHWLDHYRACGERLDAMVARIPTGIVMRPHKSGKSIEFRSLVDAVCLRNQTLTEILKSAGVSVNGRKRKELREALGHALDRMAGIHEGVDIVSTGN